MTATPDDPGRAFGFGGDDDVDAAELLRRMFESDDDETGDTDASVAAERGEARPAAAAVSAPGDDSVWPSAPGDEPVAAPEPDELIDDGATMPRSSLFPTTAHDEPAIALGDEPSTTAPHDERADTTDGAIADGVGGDAPERSWWEPAPATGAVETSTPAMTFPESDVSQSPVDSGSPFTASTPIAAATARSTGSGEALLSSDAPVGQATAAGDAGTDATTDAPFDAPTDAEATQLIDTVDASSADGAGVDGGSNGEGDAAAESGDAAAESDAHPWAAAHDLGALLGEGEAIRTDDESAIVPDGPAQAADATPTDTEADTVTATHAFEGWGTTHPATDATSVIPSGADAGVSVITADADAPQSAEASDDRPLAPVSDAEVGEWAAATSTPTWTTAEPGTTDHLGANAAVEEIAVEEIAVEESTVEDSTVEESTVTDERVDPLTPEFDADPATAGSDEIDPAAPGLGIAPAWLTHRDADDVPDPEPRARRRGFGGRADVDEATTTAAAPAFAGATAGDAPDDTLTVDQPEGSPTTGSGTDSDTATAATDTGTDATIETDGPVVPSSRAEARELATGTLTTETADEATSTTGDSAPSPAPSAPSGDGTTAAASGAAGGAAGSSLGAMAGSAGSAVSSAAGTAAAGIAAAAAGIAGAIGSRFGSSATHGHASDPSSPAPTADSPFAPAAPNAYASPSAAAGDDDLTAVIGDRDADRAFPAFPIPPTPSAAASSGTATSAPAAVTGSAPTAAAAKQPSRSPYFAPWLRWTILGAAAVSAILGVLAIFRPGSTEVGGSALVVVAVLLALLGIAGRLPKRLAGSGWEIEFAPQAVQDTLDLVATQAPEAFDAVARITRDGVLGSDASLEPMIRTAQTKIDTDATARAEALDAASAAAARPSLTVEESSSALERTVSVRTGEGRSVELDAVLTVPQGRVAITVVPTWLPATGPLIARRINDVLSADDVDAAIVLVPASAVSDARAALSDHRIGVIDIAESASVPLRAVTLITR